MTKDDARISYIKSGVQSFSNLNIIDTTHNLSHIHNRNINRPCDVYTVWNSMKSDGFPHSLNLFRMNQGIQLARTECTYSLVLAQSIII